MLDGGGEGSEARTEVAGWGGGGGGLIETDLLFSKS